MVGLWLAFGYDLLFVGNNMLWLVGLFDCLYCLLLFLFYCFSGFVVGLIVLFV